MMAGATHKMDISEMNTKRSSLDSGSATRKSKETTNEVQVCAVGDRSVDGW